MKLSNDFWLNEFTKSIDATRKGLDNTPTPEALVCIKDLVNEVLQPLRIKLGLVISVNSGYRSPVVNKAVGGSKTSQHMLGQAADIEVQGLANYDLAKFIVDSGLVFDQLILEFPSKTDPAAGWVHVSYKRGANKKQVMTAVKEGGKTVYKSGLLKP